MCVCVPACLCLCARAHASLLSYPTHRHPFSAHRYDLLDVNVQRVADTYNKPFLPKDGVDSFGVAQLWVEAFQRSFWAPFTRGLQQAGVLAKPKEDPWKLALNRFNQMVTVKLSPKGAGGKGAFCVGTYHMPCMFRSPSVMTIHCALSAQHIQRYARGMPYVYCGDFNIKPDSPMYDLFTRGRLPDEQAEESPVPHSHPADPWVPRLQQPLVSAYASASTAQGGRSDEHSDYRGEPDFTNHARVRDEEPFVDCLDYIMLGNAFSSSEPGSGSGSGRSSGSDGLHQAAEGGRQWTVQSVKPLLHRDDATGPYPAFQQPSDHVLLSANLSLVAGSTQRSA